MSISIYKFDESTLSFSAISEGTFDTPVVSNVEPGGKVSVQKLFLRNDDNTKYYTDLTLTPCTTIGGDITSGTVVIKLLSGAKKPTEAEWAAAPANSLSILESPTGEGTPNRRIPELGSAAAADLKYYPFWLRVEVTRSTPLGNFRFSLKISYTEQVV